NLAIVVPPALKTGLGGGDYLSFYAGGRLAFSPDLYNPAAVAALQSDLGWQTRNLPFMRLPAYAALHWPLSRLPYPVALGVWLAANLAALAACIWLAPAALRPTAALVLAWLLPAYVALQQAQDTPLILLFLTAALLLLGKSDLAAGALLALCAFKIHLFLGLAVFVLRRGSKALWMGGAATGALLALASFATQGPDWPRRLLAAAATPAGNRLDNMPAFPALWHDQPFLIAAAAAAALALAWIAAGHRSRPAALALSLAPGLLVSPHIYLQDWLLLAPALTLALANRSRIALAVLAPPIAVLALLGLRIVPMAALALFALAAAREAWASRREPMIG
ncbi:MAG TPA: hypothetical protein DEH78_14895, partial [Solibacterales bacterium]|nr:hypothetical protein [Bryobacterales bacterium]